MNVTKELRRFANSGMLAMECVTYSDKLNAIADRIDAAHEEAIQQALMGEGGMPATDENMAKHGWVRLPKDADDVPWNVGDCDEDGNEVTELRLTKSGWCVLTDDEWPYRPERHRHNYVLTVEDVMVKFATNWEHESDCMDRAALLKKYAAKLQLTEEGAYE